MLEAAQCLCTCRLAAETRARARTPVRTIWETTLTVCAQLAHRKASTLSRPYRARGCSCRTVTWARVHRMQTLSSTGGKTRDRVRSETADVGTFHSTASGCSLQQTGRFEPQPSVRHACAPPARAPAARVKRTSADVFHLRHGLVIISERTDLSRVKTANIANSILKHLLLRASNTSRSHRARTDTRSYPTSTGVSMAGPLHQRCCRTAAAGGNQAPGLSPAMNAPAPAAGPKVAQEACDHTVRFGSTSAASLYMCCRSPSAWTRFRSSRRATAPDSTGGK